MTSSFLTRDEIFGLEDITTKELTIPSNIPAWGGRSLLIRQLTRGQQDEYLRRQFGSMKMRQDTRAKQQELSSANIYGHDAWLFARGVVNHDGKPMFTDADIAKLNEKSGEAIGWVAGQIVEFSGMRQEVDEAKAIEQAETEVKN
jgi:hypothetical protein